MEEIFEGFQQPDICNHEWKLEYLAKSFDLEPNTDGSSNSDRCFSIGDNSDCERGYSLTYDYSESYSASCGFGKCRQLPCKTWISTGTCPYNDKCYFLHDPRVSSYVVPLKVKKRSKEDITHDLFFWPTMPREVVAMRLDAKNSKYFSVKSNQNA